MNYKNNEGKILLNKLLNSKIIAQASIKGDEKKPGTKDISGEVDFYNFGNGSVILSTIHNLPRTETNIFAFHIHEIGDCSDDFLNAGAHYGDENHPNHKGDMPPLFSNNGDAFQLFYTERFSIDEIVGRSIIIHEQPDDFTSQPSGNSGARIACGIISKTEY